MEIMKLVTGPFYENCYVVRYDDALTVVDPGMGAAETVTEYMKEHDLRLDQVLLTHGHIDHTRDAAELADTHGVPVWIHPDDEFMLAHGDGVTENARTLFHAETMRTPDDVRHYEDGAEVNVGPLRFAVRHAPGHSPGCVLLVGKKLCFSGDVVFAGSIGRTDLPDSDPQAMVSTLRNVVAPLPRSLSLLPGHGDHTTMDKELRTNPFLA